MDNVSSYIETSTEQDRFSYVGGFALASRAPISKGCDERSVKKNRKRRKKLGSSDKMNTESMESYLVSIAESRDRNAFKKLLNAAEGEAGVKKAAKDEANKAAAARTKRKTAANKINALQNLSKTNKIEFKKQLQNATNINNVVKRATKKAETKTEAQQENNKKPVNTANGMVSALRRLWEGTATPQPTQRTNAKAKAAVNKSTRRAG